MRLVLFRWCLLSITLAVVVVAWATPRPIQALTIINDHSITLTPYFEPAGRGMHRRDRRHEFLLVDRRAQADAINAQRRAEKEVEKARKFALEGFSKEVLVVADNLERALSLVNPEDEAIKSIVDGIELTLKSFGDVLAKFNIEAVDPHGEPFDPQLHQAMSMVPNPEVDPNTVIAVMQKGYTLNGRLIRPAMVMVSKAE